MKSMPPNLLRSSVIPRTRARTTRAGTALILVIGLASLDGAAQLTATSPLRSEGDEFRDLLRLEGTSIASNDVEWKCAQTGSGRRRASVNR